MPNNRRSVWKWLFGLWIAFGALGVVALVLLVAVVPALSGPTAEEGYEIIFGEFPSEGVRGLRIEHYKHLKGHGIYLGFRTAPELIESLVGFDLADAQPMYYRENDYYVPWQYEEVFRELYPESFRDQKFFRRHIETEPRYRREFVISPEKGYVLCSWCSDSEIKP